MKKKILFILFNSIILASIFSQPAQFNPENYSAIESSGVIPDDFVTLSSEKYNDDIKDIEGSFWNRQSRLQKTYYKEINFSIDDLLLSGRVTFGDPLSVYANKIMDKILANDPTLRSKIRIYHLKSPTLNALSTAQGIIFVNTGLFAYLENEAQLAYVLCHELAHYTQKHSWEIYNEKHQSGKGRGLFGDLSIDEKLEHVLKYKTENEYEADSLGFNRYVSLDYNSDEAIRLLEKLHYSYLPFNNSPINSSFLSIGDFKIPQIFFKESVSTITPIRDSYDKYHTHPNIYKRSSKIKAQNKDQEKFESDFQVYTKSQYEALQELAKFESIRLMFLRKNYGDIIYNSSVLLNKYPENKFLELSRVKALYGLSKFRTAEEYHLVTRPYSRIEGESQQVYYFLRQLSPKQLNVIALKHVTDALSKYPKEGNLDQMQTELINDLVIKHDLTLNDFNSTIENYEINNTPQGLAKSEIKQLQKKHRNFILNAFVHSTRNPSLIKKFNEAEIQLTKENEKVKLTYKQKEKLKEKEEKNIRLNGIKTSSIIVLDPLYIEFNNSTMDYLDSEKYKLKLDNALKELLSTKHYDSHIITSKNIKNSDLDKYNIMCKYKEWQAELLTKNKCSLLPLSTFHKKNSLLKDSNILCCPSLYRKNNTLYYNMLYYNLETGEELFDNNLTISSFNLGIKRFTKDIDILRKH
jgi:hypothetical protein